MCLKFLNFSVALLEDGSVIAQSFIHCRPFHEHLTFHQFQSNIGIDRKYDVSLYVWIGARIQDAIDLWSKRSGSGRVHHYFLLAYPVPLRPRSNFDSKADSTVCPAYLLWCVLVRQWSVPSSSVGWRRLQKWHFTFRTLAHPFSSMEKWLLPNSTHSRIAGDWTVDRDFCSSTIDPRNFEYWHKRVFLNIWNIHC